jgi:hypothetical protein
VGRDHRGRRLRLRRHHRHPPSPRPRHRHAPADGSQRRGADLLDANAYGAGALLRWESSATVDGVYVEGGTIALVADVSLYDVWDPAGAVGTWYRTRISDAGGTTFSAYSSPFQTAEHGLYLSADQFRLLAPTSLADEALLILLDAAAEEIVRHAGPSGEITERLRGRGDALMLSRPCLSVTSIVEHDVTLDPDDYELSSTRQVLWRLTDGPNPRRWWGHHVRVTYLPVDDLAERQRAQAELVKLSIAFSPSLASQTIGTWSESYVTNPKPYAEQRSDILATLTESGGSIL